jgi:hypothetical protein
MYISATADAKNTGYHINFDESKDPMPSGGPLGIGKLITNNGTTPIVVDRVPYQVWFPTNLSGQLHGYDLARRQRFDKPITDGHLAHDGSELYLASLTVDIPGTHAITTPRSDKFIPSSAPQASLPPSLGKAADPELSTIWSPLQGVRWGQTPSEVESGLRSSGINLGKVTLGPNLLHLSGTDALFRSSAEMDITFTDGEMTSLNVTFTQPPVLGAIVDEYDKRLGPAIEKKIASSEDQISTVRWTVRSDKGKLLIVLTETQGTIGIVYQLSY